MAWVKLDDNFPTNRKVVELGADAFRLYVEALCYCGSNLTDGHLTPSALRRLWEPDRATELVAAGLWLQVEDGYEVKDYLKYNPSREQVETEREKAAERKRRWLEQRRNGGKNGVPNKGNDGAANAHPLPDPARPEGPRAGESVATETAPPIVSAPVPDEVRQQNLAQVRQLRTQEAVG